MLAPWKRQLLAATTILIYYYWFRESLQNSYRELVLGLDEPGAANSTLGFGAVYVVSGPNSPRRPHIIQAANVTGIDLTIPNQPSWTTDDVRTFYEGGDVASTKGSVYAWFAHDRVLQEFIHSGHETALILEDDVDWDIHLRTIQIPLAAAAIRSYSDQFSSRPGPPARRYRSTPYYGDTNAWELLYIGHCGDYFDSVSETGFNRPLHPSDLATINHTFYLDETLPRHRDLHPFTAEFLGSLNVPERTRMAHQSVWPLCTFAYAVTRAAAIRIREQLAPPRATHEAFDVAMMHACRGEEGKGLRCVTVNPELFHHMQGESLIGQQNPEAVGMPPVDSGGFEQTMRRQETSNIGCGFWSRDFEFNGDAKLMEFLRREVGVKGRCLKPGRE